MRTGWFSQGQDTPSNHPTPGDFDPCSVPKPRRDSAILKHLHPAWLAGLSRDQTVGMPENIPTFVAIGGGKGGVGKSLLSANLAGKLGQMGFRILLVDFDLGSANLHTYFGVNLPKQNLNDLLTNPHLTLDNVIIDTPVYGVKLLASGRDEAWTEGFQQNTHSLLAFWKHLIQSKETYGVDVVIVDLGAGIHKHLMDFFISAHLGIVTVLPEPTSIENAYSFLKAGMGRLIEHVGNNRNELHYAEAIRLELFESAPNKTRTTYTNKLLGMRTQYGDFIDEVRLALQGRQVGFVVNQVRSQKDMDIAPSMQVIAGDYFGYNTRSLGFINYDDAAWKALRNRRLLLNDFPHSLLARRVGEIARNIISTLGYS